MRLVLAGRAPIQRKTPPSTRRLPAVAGAAPKAQAVPPSATLATSTVPPVMVRALGGVGPWLPVAVLRPVRRRTPPLPRAARRTTLRVMVPLKTEVPLPATTTVRAPPALSRVPPPERPAKVQDEPEALRSTVAPLAMARAVVELKTEPAASLRVPAWARRLPVNVALTSVERIRMPVCPASPMVRSRVPVRVPGSLVPPLAWAVLIVTDPVVPPRARGVATVAPFPALIRRVAGALPLAAPITVDPVPRAVGAWTARMPPATVMLPVLLPAPARTTGRAPSMVRADAPLRAPVMVIWAVVPVAVRHV